MRTAPRASLTLSLLTVGLMLLAACGASGGSDAAGKTTTSATVTTTDAGGKSTTTATDTSTPSGDETTTSTDQPTTTGGSDDKDVCTALKRISDYDATTQDATTRPWPELQQEFIDGTKGVLSAYDDAIAAADPDLVVDLKKLQDITAPTADIAAQSSSVTEFASKFTDLPGILEAGQAGQRLDAYARANCGFGTSAAGGPLGG